MRERGRRECGGEMIFEMEVDDSDVRDAARRRNKLSPKTREAIQLLASPGTSYAEQLLQHVRKHKKACEHDSHGTDALRAMTDKLRGLGYNSVLMATACNRNDTTCFEHHHHVFIEVRPSESSASTCLPRSSSTSDEAWDDGSASSPSLIVEVGFRDVFRIHRPTPRYTEVLSVVPDEFVGPRDRLSSLLTLLCKEMESAFVVSGLSVPPWRRLKGMSSRWSPQSSGLKGVGAVRSEPGGRKPAAKDVSFDVVDSAKVSKSKGRSCLSGALKNISGGATSLKDRQGMCDINHNNEKECVNMGKTMDAFGDEK